MINVTVTLIWTFDDLYDIAQNLYINTALIKEECYAHGCAAADTGKANPLY